MVFVLQNIQLREKAFTKLVEPYAMSSSVFSQGYETYFRRLQASL
jgi:hypothetical protein